MTTNVPYNLAFSLKEQTNSTTLIPIYQIDHHKSFLNIPGSRTAIIDLVGYKNLPTITAPLAAGADIVLDCVYKGIKSIKVKSLYIGWNDIYYDEVYKFDVNLSPIQLDFQTIKLNCSVALNKETVTLDGAYYNALHPDKFINKGNFTFNVNLLLKNNKRGVFNLSGLIEQNALVFFPNMAVLGYDLHIEYDHSKAFTTILSSTYS